MSDEEKCPCCGQRLPDKELDGLRADTKLSDEFFNWDGHDDFGEEDLCRDEASLRERATKWMAQTELDLRGHDADWFVRDYLARL